MESNLPEVNVLEWITDFDIFNKSRTEIVEYFGPFISKVGKNFLLTSDFLWGKADFSALLHFDKERVTLITLDPFAFYDLREHNNLEEYIRAKEIYFKNFFESLNLQPVNEQKNDWKFNDYIISLIFLNNSYNYIIGIEKLIN